jgi:hypothetical protein
MQEVRSFVFNFRFCSLAWIAFIVTIFLLPLIESGSLERRFKEAAQMSRTLLINKLLLRKSIALQN